MDFSNSKSIKGYRSSYSLPDLEQHESSYNLLTQGDPGEKPLKPGLFWKENTSELTAKTKVSDSIFTTKLGLSQSLMLQKATPKLNVTLKARNFCGLLGQKAHKTQQNTLFHPKRGGLSLTLMDQGQTYNPICSPKWLPNTTLGLNWDGSARRAHNTANFCDWSVSNQEQISLVEIFSLIS